MLENFIVIILVMAFALIVLAIAIPAWSVYTVYGSIRGKLRMREISWKIASELAEDNIAEIRAVRLGLMLHNTSFHEINYSITMAVHFTGSLTTTQEGSIAPGDRIYVDAGLIQFDEPLAMTNGSKFTGSLGYELSYGKKKKSLKETKTLQIELHREGDVIHDSFRSY